LTSPGEFPRLALSDLSVRTARPVENAALAFGPFRLNPAERLLLRDGKPLRLGGRALDILIALVERAGETVLKDQLIGRVWPDTLVDESALRVHVATLRKALGDGRDGNRFIENIPGRGYVFVAPVTPEQRQEAAKPSSRLVHVSNLPTPLTRVIGRAEIIATIAERVPQRRFRPGGIGKTTVAVAAAETRSGSYPDGVWFVSLGSLQDAALVPSAVSAALGSKRGVGDPLSSLLAWLRDKRALIILDSCEHVISAAAAITEAILKAAPQIAVLATSQEPLRAEGEWLLRVPPLEVAPEISGLTAAEALGFSAVELFNERATAALDSFVLTDADAPVALEICRRLDGVPLAIELAAAQVDGLGIRGLAGALDKRLAVLTRGRRTAPPRQQTLRATIDWSYELLSESERHLLCCLAVFPTGFTSEAAAAVVCGHRDALIVVSEGIAGLVTKSLVSRDAAAPMARWRLLQTIRAYAREKLAQRGEASAAGRRHAEFFRDLVVPTATNPALRISNDDVVRYGREIDNIRAALDWSFSPEGDAAVGVVLTAAFAPVWLHLGLVAECGARAERALDLLAPDFELIAPLRMQLHLGFGVALFFTTGSGEKTRAALAKALEIAEYLDDVDAQLGAARGLFACSLVNGEQRIAQRLAARFSELANRKGDAADVLVGDRLVGAAMHYAGDQPKARYHIERVINLYVAPSDPRYTTWFLSEDGVVARAWLARVLWLQGLVDQAKQNAQICADDAQTVEHQLSLCYALGWALCPIALRTGDLALAEQSLATLIDVATKHNYPSLTRLGPCLEGALLIKRGETSRGLRLLYAAHDISHGAQFAVHFSGFLGDLAEGLAGIGCCAEALTMIDRGLDQYDRDGLRWCMAELLRIKGEVLLQTADDQSISAADNCFHEALEVAREQGALFWELRAAMSLARFRMRQDRREDARQTLAPVYGRFTEGFETADLSVAKALLRELC